MHLWEMVLEELNKVALAVCLRDKIPSSFVFDMLGLIHHPEVRTYLFGRATLLPMARNKVLEQVDLDNYTHVLLVDDDMYNFNQGHLSRMLSLDLDMVGAVCTLKQPPYQVAGQLMDPKAMLKELQNQDVNGREPQECKSIGTAFVLMKTEVLKKTYEETNEGDKLWFTMDRMQRPNTMQDAKALIKSLPPKPSEDDLLDLVQLGVDAHKGTPLLGEDISFCCNVRRAGYRIWMDPAVVINHTGDYHYGIKDTEQWNRLSSQERDQQAPVLLQACSKD